MKVYCILSDERVYRSRSAGMFNAILARTGIKGCYVPFCVQPRDLGQALNSIRILNIAGANITVPYKEEVIPYLDVLSEGANIIGAINTIVRNGDVLKGYNTNAIGVMDALGDAKFDADGKTALVFGTGGAAKAVVFILNWLRTDKILIAGRKLDKAQQLVDRFGGEAVALDQLSGSTVAAQIVINATSVSSPDEAPDLDRLVRTLQAPDCELMLDLNYGRIDNFWRDWAQSRKMRFMDGLCPLAYQARRTFALWTGSQVPPGEFISALKTGA